MPKKPKHRYNDSKWTNLRQIVLQEANYRCWGDDGTCERRATQVDHIQPASEAPHLFLVRSNLRASCPKHNCGRPSTRAAALLAANQARGERRAW